MRVKDAYDNFFNSLDAIGGHKGSDDKAYVLDFDKFFGYEVEDFELEGKDRLADWKWRVKQALSDRLPARFRHEKRPSDREYPFRDTGELRSNVNVGMTASVYGKSKAKIKFWADLSSPHAHYTDLNIRGRKDGSRTDWYGWIHRVFEQGDKSRGILSIRDIFDQMTKSRRMNKGSR